MNELMISKPEQQFKNNLKLSNRGKIKSTIFIQKKMNLTYLLNFLSLNKFEFSQQVSHIFTFFTRKQSFCRANKGPREKRVATICRYNLILLLPCAVPL